MASGAWISRACPYQAYSECLLSHLLSADLKFSEYLQATITDIAEQIQTFAKHMSISTYKMEDNEILLRDR